MLFDAVSFLECLFKQNFCLVLFPSCLLCLVYLGILHPPRKKHLKFEAEFFINLAPMCWIDCPPTHKLPPKKVHPILAQATTIFSEPPPWDSYLNHVAFFGDFWWLFFDQNFQVRELPLTNSHKQRRPPNFHVKNQIFNPAENLEAVTKATPPMTSSINGCQYKIFGACEDWKKEWIGLTNVNQHTLALAPNQHDLFSGGLHSITLPRFLKWKQKIEIVVILSYSWL